MRYRRLGRSEIEVSALCLGTMTWGEQNSEAEGFEQMDFAFEQGINFLDTAEMYPIATRAETYGRTEQITGNWMAARGHRDKVVVATKVVGPSTRFPYIRGGTTRFNREHITAALDDSLKRLRTDFVDLNQLHWPDRGTNTFGQLAYEHDPQEEMTPFEETLEALEAVVSAGKVRTVGLSNENPWGAMKFLQLAEAGLGPRMVSVQNAYSFLNRSFETRMAEVAIREDCRLLAYAPLAAGALTGKYLDGAQPSGSRRVLWPDNLRYKNPQAEAAIRAYVDLAAEHGLDPAQMALSYVASRPFLTAAIIGATNMTQLRTNVASVDVDLGPEVLAGIEAVHKVHTYPCP